MPAYFTYGIKSSGRNYIYAGITDDLERRLHQHNQGWSRATKPYRPFILFYWESFPDRESARKREVYLKTSSGKNFLRARLKEFEQAQGNGDRQEIILEGQ